MRAFTVNACERDYPVHCRDDESAALVETLFGAMLRPADTAATSTPWREVAVDDDGFRIVTADETVEMNNPSAFLFNLDKDLTIDLQRHRSDLFFLHGAALALDGKVVVVSAPSGTGKSTLAWALLQDGFDYLSDELAPVDMNNLNIHPYPHALCMKSLPPAPYKLPAQALDVGDCLHIPTQSLKVTIRRQPLPLAALIFIKRDIKAATAAQPLSPATSAAYLMSNVLNALAHPGQGLDAAISLAGRVPCFELNSNDLAVACRTVRGILNSHDASTG